MVVGKTYRGRLRRFTFTAPGGRDQWGKAGADSKTVLGAYIFVEDTFTLSFELAALFLVAVGLALFNAGRWLRIIAGGAILIAAIVFVSGLIGTVAIESGIPQVGFLLFDLWSLVAGIYLLIRPPLTGRGSQSAGSVSTARGAD